MLSRKLRAIAKVYDAQPGPFVRDLIEATVEGGLRAQLFQERLTKGMERYATSGVVLGGSDAGTWSAPEKPTEEAAPGRNAKRKGKKRERHAPPGR
jgi:hypothetical protein